MVAENDLVRVVRNVNAAPRNAGYSAGLDGVLPAAGFDSAFNEISGWPGYAPTPLIALAGLAAEFGIDQLLYKEERHRFGLNSFKALGGAYAVMRVLAKKLAHRGVPDQITSRDLAAGRWREITGDITVVSATDGNHGRSVAWGARTFGCRCVIFVHESVSQGRRDAIGRYGAQVREVKGNYDDAVRHAAATAATEGWTVVSDTSYPGYSEIPLDVMHGYGVMAAEVVQQLANSQPPTHVFAQAGVGALAGAVCATFWLQWGDRRPRFVVVEPTHADCVYRSLEAGHPVVVDGALDTVMAGLACGEVSELAWEVLQSGTNVALAIDDRFALQAMRALAEPTAGDAAVVAGETGCVGLAALLAAQDRPALQRALALNEDSRVLLLGSEGDTDPLIYRQVVGRSAAEVLA